MSKSRNFFNSTDCYQNMVRRTTSDSNHSASRTSTKHETNTKMIEDKNDLHQHPPLMRKKSHFFQVHHRDAIDTTPTIEFSPSDDDGDCGDAGRSSSQGHNSETLKGPILEELVDDKTNSEIEVGNPSQGSTKQRESVLSANSETSLISKRALKKRLARLLLHSCDIYDVDNNLPGDQSLKFSLR